MNDIFGRTMKVKIGSTYSETQYIPLRPLLFLIFVNDLSNDIKLEIELFADVKQFVRPL